MSADDKQVSGTHYKTKDGGVQHWTYCIRAEVPNLEYAASKYITRWRKKGGTKDIEKAIHYMEKRLESFDSGIGAKRGGKRIDMMFAEFIRDNEVPGDEALALDFIMHWSAREHLVTIILFLRKLLALEEAREADDKASEEQFEREIAWSKANDGC